MLSSKTVNWLNEKKDAYLEDDEDIISEKEESSEESYKENPKASIKAKASVKTTSAKDTKTISTKATSTKKGRPTVLTREAYKARGIERMSMKTDKYFDMLDCMKEFLYWPLPESNYGKGVEIIRLLRQFKEVTLVDINDLNFKIDLRNGKLSHRSPALVITLAEGDKYITNLSNYPKPILNLSVTILSGKGINETHKVMYPYELSSKISYMLRDTNIIRLV